MLTIWILVYAILAASWGRHIFYYVMHPMARGFRAWLWFTAQAVFWPLSMPYWAVHYSR